MVGAGVDSYSSMPTALGVSLLQIPRASLKLLFLDVGGYGRFCWTGQW